MAMFEPLAAAITVGNKTGEGNSAISSRLWPATRGRKASTNALGLGRRFVAHLPKFAAISFSLVTFVRNPHCDSIGQEEPEPGDREHMAMRRGEVAVRLRGFVILRKGLQRIPKFHYTHGD